MHARIGADAQRIRVDELECLADRRLLRLCRPAADDGDHQREAQDVNPPARQRARQFPRIVVSASGLDHPMQASSSRE
jgi:hypothetical protein